jgi:tetraacyldisaccharide 4'-kinase
MASIHQLVNRLWYQGSRKYCLLLPFSGVFYLLTQIRKLYYKNIYTRKVFPVPVITVGNLTVGGSGKTPMVIYLVNVLREIGYKPGVVARGYKSNAGSPQAVDDDCQSSDVGDEPLLIYLKTGVPVVVGKNRVKNIDFLIDSHPCDIVICDDGLQDYRFRPAVEIVMVDGERKFGNRQLLPAGPLRESERRLKECDYVIATATPLPDMAQYFMSTEFVNAVKLNNVDSSRDIKSWVGTTVHAVAGIGNPERFFNSLKRLGISIIRHPFADHAEYSVKDLTFNDQLPVLMTEKDAVKCRNMDIDNAWYAPIKAIMPKQFISELKIKLRVNDG